MGIDFAWIWNAQVMFQVMLQKAVLVQRASLEWWEISLCSWLK